MKRMLAIAGGPLALLFFVVALAGCDDKAAAPASGGPEGLLAPIQTPSDPPPAAAADALPEPDDNERTRVTRAFAESDYVTLPNTRIQLPKPEGFDLADEFDGFMQESTRSSVLALTMPAPFDEVTAGFTPQQMLLKAMRLKTKDTIRVGGNQGLLLGVWQRAAGIDFNKWIVVFGDAEQTTLITATYPEVYADDLTEPLRNVVLSARSDTTAKPAPEARAGFAITPIEPFKAADTVTGPSVLSYTLGGKAQMTRPGEPVFIAAASLGSAPVGGHKQATIKRLFQTALISEVLVEETTAVRIDGLEGYAVRAAATHTPTSTPITLYHVMLFDDRSYYILQGRVGQDEEDRYLPMFKDMAASFKRGPR